MTFSEGERSPMTETSTFFSGGTTDANQPTGQTSLASRQTQATEIMTGSASSTVPSTEEVTRPECCPEECTEGEFIVRMHHHHRDHHLYH